MTINETEICFDSCTSDEMGFIVVNSIGSVVMTGGDEKSTLVTSKNTFKETHDLHYISYDEPLQFPIILIKSDYTYMNADDERNLKKWLCKNSRRWLQVIQDDIADIYYYCIINNPEKVNISGYSGAIKLDVTCDCHHAWSKLYKKPYTTINGTLSPKLNFTFDYDQYVLYPQLSIKSLSASPQTISIKNETTNETLSIQNCVLNEQLLIDCKNDTLHSSTGRILLNNWNRQMISMIEGVNQLLLTGNLSMELSYRLPIRVGG